MKEQQNEKEKKNTDLTSVVSTAIQIPGVKVSRHDFLCNQFKEMSPDVLSLILEKGPLEAGISRQDLRKKASRIIKERTAISSSASFLAGLPGGIAMVATIPADLLQFYGVALRMAQELVYLYGEEDLWCDGTPDTDKITNQLILYCGVMLGASGAAQAVRIMSSALAKQALKKLPQMALTKTFYYPVIKAILKFFGVSLTKGTFAKGVAKVVPVIGGVVSGGITLASMLPMGNRLADTLDQAHFDYTEEDFKKDIHIITEICAKEAEQAEESEDLIEVEASETIEVKAPSVQSKETIIEQIQQAKQLLDNDIITEEEYSKIKEKLISQL